MTGMIPSAARLASSAALLLVLFASKSAAAVFEDAFEGPLSTAAWRADPIWGKAWRTGGGFLLSEAVENRAGMGDARDKLLDVLTRREDFGDADLSFDIRFDNQGIHKDHRLVYVRASPPGPGAAEPSGVELLISVWMPYPDPGHYVSFRRRSAGGSVAALTPLTRCSLSPGRWYSVRLRAVGGDFRVRIWPREEPEPAGWTLSARDPSAPRRGAVGFGSYWAAATAVDNVRVAPPADR